MKAILQAHNLSVRNADQKYYEKAATDYSHTSAFTIGTGKVKYGGAARDIVVVVVRGTSGGEWHSNFDFAPSHDDNTLYAENFYQASTDIYTYVKRAIARTSNPIVLFTGFSRGAACANLLGVLYNNEYGSSNGFVYTFATPNTIRSASVCSDGSNIFNVLNPADVVTMVPPVEIGFFRAGTDIMLPDTNHYATGIKQMLSSVTTVATGIKSYYEDKHSLVQPGLDPENGMSVYDLFEQLANVAGGGDVMAALRVLSQIQRGSDLYPFFSLAITLSAGSESITSQHQPNTYIGLLNEFCSDFFSNSYLIYIYAYLTAVAYLEEGYFSCRIIKIGVLSDYAPVAGLSAKLEGKRSEIDRCPFHHMLCDFWRACIENLIEAFVQAHVSHIVTSAYNCYIFRWEVKLFIKKNGMILLIGG